MPVCLPCLPACLSGEDAAPHRARPDRHAVGSRTPRTNDRVVHPFKRFVRPLPVAFAESFSQYKPTRQEKTRDFHQTQRRLDSHSLPNYCPLSHLTVLPLCRAGFAGKFEGRDAHLHWTQLYARECAPSPLALVPLHLDVPLQMRPGAIRGIYIHSARPGDKARGCGCLKGWCVCNHRPQSN